MWRFEHVVQVQASRQVVWQWWTDVEKWPRWDTDLIESAVLGEFAVGTQGRMKVADDALVAFTISEVIPEERFVMQIALFGATLSYTHMMTEEDGLLKITHGAEVTGIFGFIWRMVLKAKIEKTLVPALDELAKQVSTEAERLATIAREVPPVVPAEESEVPVAQAENSEVAATSVPVVAVVTPDVPKPAGGDPVENELRKQDIHTQIEVAAQAPVAPMAATEVPPVEAQVIAESPVEDDAHTAIVPVSPVVTKKETKRPKKA